LHPPLTAPFNTQAGAPPVSLAGDRIELRQHWTLADTFPVTGFAATGSSTTADQIMFFAKGDWTTYWLYNDGVGPKKWVTVLDPATDQGGTVIAPGYGIYVNPRLTTAPLLAYGYVRANKFARPLDMDNNLVGGGYPLDQSPNSRGMTLANGFIGTANFKTADQFLLWKGDSTPGASGYITDYLLDGSATIKRWVKVGDATIASQSNLPLFPGDRSIFIKTAVSSRPNYVMPLPWLP
jgi:hypothetical protein